MATQPSIRRLLAVRDAGRVLIAIFLSSVAWTMTSIALPLLTLQQFHSATLAGIVLFFNTLGAMISPLMGTLLDLYSRRRLIVLDFLVAGVGTSAIGVLTLTDRLTAPQLVLLSGLAGLTSSLSSVGLRIALPTTVPTDLVDMATAISFNARAVSRVFAPLLPGVLITLFNPGWALLACAATYAVGACFASTIHDPPRVSSAPTQLWAETSGAVRYCVTNHALRSLLTYTGLAFLGWSMFYGALAPLVEQSMHHRALVVGLVMTTFGAADVIGGLVSAHRDTRNKEWLYLSGGAVIATVGLAVSASAWLPLVFFGAALIGFAETPVDHVVHVVRQRAGDPALIARIVATGMAFSAVVASLGIVAAGWISSRSPELAFVIGGAITLIGAIYAARTPSLRHFDTTSEFGRLPMDITHAT